MSGPGSDGKTNKSRGFESLEEAEKLEKVGMNREMAKATVQMVRSANKNATKADLYDLYFASSKMSSTNSQMSKPNYFMK